MKEDLCTPLEPMYTLLFSVESLALATDIGRTLIYEAIQKGELKTHLLHVGGKNRKRRVIRPEDAQAWVDTFPESVGVKS